MANPLAGEARVVIDGVPHRAKLTLGALAELEHTLGAQSLTALAERFEGGNVSASDVLALIAAGLRGGGWTGTRADLMQADIEGGASGGRAARPRLRAAAMSARIDWGGWMRAGIRERGLTPREFWALTPAELMLILGRDATEAPFSRARLEELARQWPDKQEQTDG